MSRINRKFAKGIKDDGTLDYAPTAFNFNGRDYLHPTDADYEAAGFMRVIDKVPGVPPAEGWHYEPRGWEEQDGVIRRVYVEVIDPPPPPRRWFRLSIKVALADAGMITEAEAYLSSVEIRKDYTAWSALTDCNYIEEGYGGMDKWNAILDGAATAFGKTREEIDAFLDAIPTEVC